MLGEEEQRKVGRIRKPGKVEGGEGGEERGNGREQRKVGQRRRSWRPWMVEGVREGTGNVRGEEEEENEEEEDEDETDKGREVGGRRGRDKKKRGKDEKEKGREENLFNTYGNYAEKLV